MHITPDRIERVITRLLKKEKCCTPEELMRELKLFGIDVQVSLKVLSKMADDDAIFLGRDNLLWFKGE